MYVQTVFIVIALAAILLWFGGGYKQAHAKDSRLSLPAIILALWIIVSAAFGPYFFVLRFPGLFDISMDRLLLVVIISFLVTGLFRGKVYFQNSGIEMVMGLFALVCIISMIRTGFLPFSPEFPSPWFAFISGYLFPFIVFVFAKHYIVTEKDMMVILHTLFYFGIYLSITAFFEYTDLRQFVFPKYINDPLVSTLHLNRARGPFLNAAVNGVAILVGFISGVHLLEKKHGFTKFFYQTSLLLFFPAVFFTLTRSVYLGLIIALVILLVFYKASFSKWKLLSLPIVMVLILGIANSPRLISTERREGGVAQLGEVNIRFALLQQSAILFSEKPLTGIGLAQFVPSTVLSFRGPKPYILDYGEGTFQHNHLMGIATELGIPGLLLYLTLIILILRRLRQLAGKLAETGIIGNNVRIAILAVWCVYLNNNLFIDPSVSLFINAIPFIFAGVADGLYTRSLESGLLSPSPIRMPQSPMRIMNGHV
ncbi:MAG: hypothetical protein A2097_11145 [Desulfobacula sp. GWF2_41_7]|nr:MAG: hypothetical protein A2097_11145 [Desulfobacula sp. GWF2_41_7]